MRILHTVQYYSPSVGGAQEVVRQISERLALVGRREQAGVGGERRAQRGVALREVRSQRRAALGSDSHDVWISSRRSSFSGCCRR